MAALSEQEEFELLSLERERAMHAQNPEGAIPTLAKGVARGGLGLMQSVADVIPNAFNLATAAGGTLGHLLGLRRDLPELPFNDLGGATANRIVQQSLDLHNRGSQFLATLGELLGGGLAGGAGGAAKTVLGKTASVVAPAIAGATGEQVGGTPGMIAATLATAMAPTAASGVTRALAKTTTPGQEAALAAEKTAAVNAAGGMATKEAVGRKLTSAIEPYMAAQSRTYANLDTQIASRFAPGEKVPIANYKAELDRLVTRSPDARSALNTLLGRTGNIEKAAANVPDEMTFQGLRDLRSGIGEAGADPNLVATIGKGQLKALYGALSSDLAAAAKAKGPGTEMLVERQRRFWSDHMDRVDNFLNALSKRQYEPEKVLNWALSGSKDGPTRLAELRKTISDPVLWKQVATTAAEDLGKTEGGWSAAQFAKRYTAMQPDARNVLFSVGDFQKSLERIVDKQGRIVDPIGALSSLGIMKEGVSNRVARWAFTNPDTARWLADTTRVPPEQVSAQLARLSAMANSSPDPQTREAATQLLGAFK